MAVIEAVPAPPVAAEPMAVEVTADRLTAIAELAIGLSAARADRNVREVQRCSALLDAVCRPLCGPSIRCEPVTSTRLLLPTGALELAADGDAIILRVEETADRDAAVRLTPDATARLRADLLRVLLALEDVPKETP